MLNLILKHSKLKLQPPVLFDLGAGGDEKTDWFSFKKSSKVFKLDANDNIKSRKNDKNEILIREIISHKKQKTYFNITKSIFCSSLLQPNIKELENWIFKKKFEVKKKIKVNTISFNKILKEKKIKNIDWIKLDLQGIDLKIFKSIPLSIRKKIFLVEFEPGLYNFYKTEDKLSDILEYMEKDYIIEDFKFSSSIRSPAKFFNSFNTFQKKGINFINKKTEFYTNITFLRKDFFLNKTNLRDILLMLAILISKKRFIEALFITNKFKKLDPMILKIEKKILLHIKLGAFLYFITKPFFLVKSLNTIIIRRLSIIIKKYSS